MPPPRAPLSFAYDFSYPQVSDPFLLVPWSLRPPPISSASYPRLVFKKMDPGSHSFLRHNLDDVPSPFSLNPLLYNALGPIIPFSTPFDFLPSPGHLRLISWSGPCLSPIFFLVFCDLSLGPPPFILHNPCISLPTRL